MATVVEEIVRNIVATRFETFSTEKIEDAKNRFIDIIGCAIGGVNAPGNSMVLDLLRGWGGNKEATVLIHGDKLPASNAVMMNAVMTRSFDYEATGPSPEGEYQNKGVGHNCCTTDNTALSVGELKGASGKDIITAAILGGDLAIRIAIAQEGLMDRGFDITGPMACFGATATAGKLWGLNERQMYNALGIVVDTASGCFGGIGDGVMAFKLHGALAARNGIMAVELAAKGFTGVKDPLLGRWGYFNMYTKDCHPELLTQDLGKVFHSKGRHKLFPSCYGNDTTIDAGLEVVRQHEFGIDDIEEVTLNLTPAAANGNLAFPFEVGDSQQKAIFNMRYSLANVLLRKEARLEHYTDEYIQAPRIMTLVKKIRLQPSINSDNQNTVEVKVRLKNGTVLSGHANKQKGYLDNPLTREQIKEKFRGNVVFSKAISKNNAEKALTMLENLEEVDRISQIIKHLVA